MLLFQLLETAGELETTGILETIGVSRNFSNEKKSLAFDPGIPLTLHMCCSWGTVRLLSTSFIFWVPCGYICASSSSGTDQPSYLGYFTNSIVVACNPTCNPRVWGSSCAH